MKQEEFYDFIVKCIKVVVWIHIILFSLLGLTMCLGGFY